MTVQRQQEREQERGSLLGSDKNNNDNDNDNETIRNQHGYDEYVTTDGNDNDEDNDNDDNEHSHSYSSPSVWSHRNVILLKCLSVGVILYTAALMAYAGWGNTNSNNNKASNQEQQRQQQRQSTTQYRRRLTAVMGDVIPSYMNDLNEDLRARQKLFADTPPEEVKYWFEYTGPLQKYFYRFSKSRGKADYFEGRDDSGVTSGRFTTEFLGGSHHNTMWNGGGAGGGAKPKTKPSKPGSNQHTMQYRLLENCLAMGSPKRPDTTTALWKEWYGANDGDGSGNGNGSGGLYPHAEHGDDRCRILFTLNTVGAGRGTTMLWETSPPGPPHAQGPPRWVSEQETAATHLSKQLSEIDAMCATSQVAASVQVLVCEPIDAVWTEWMDGLLPHCGGRRRQTKPKSKTNAKPNTVEERPSPVQVVVVATMDSAETCHDLKSGFMEQRTQDLILAPPYLGEKKAGSNNNNNNNNKDIDNPAIKQTHPDLVSSDDHDLYVGLKWTSLVTLRAVNSFLQASADIAAGASAPINNNNNSNSKEEEETTVVVSNAPASPFLVPSFVRVSYVSEENAKVAKWRMHGDFFHPAAWEICKDSFEVTWINHSLSGPGGVNGLCYEASTQSAMKRRLETENNEKQSGSGTGSGSGSGTDCGQWWVYMTELQMPTSPDVFANEITPPVVQGGSNFVWMLTEHQRRAVVSRQVCLHKKSKTKNKNMKKKQEDGKDDEDEADDAGCPPPAHAIMPLGDLESFLINYSPNTALGKKHIQGRRPGYSREHEREAERELVRERKQLKGQDDIEEALFDYTIYPAALFRKDATLKAARARDAVLTEEHAVNGGDADGGDSDKAAAAAEPLGPRFIKSGYYDVTVTKPRPPLLGWCQAIARKGLCTLYADYFRTSTDVRCLEACGMKKNFTPIVS